MCSAPLTVHVREADGLNVHRERESPTDPRGVIHAPYAPQRHVPSERRKCLVSVAVVNLSTMTGGTVSGEHRLDVDSLLLTSENGVGVSAVHTLAEPWHWDFAAYPQHEFVVWVDDPAAVERCYMFCSTGTGGTAFTTDKYFACSTRPRPAGNCPSLRHGWNVLRFDKAWMQPSNGAAAADWQNINRLRIFVTSNAGMTVSTWWASWRVVKPNAVIFVDFDDGDATTSQALSVLDSLGLKSTLYVNGGLIEAGEGLYGPTLSLAQLQAYYANGHDVSNHTYMHTDLAALSAEGKAAAIGDAKSWLTANGFPRSARWFATPHGQNSDAIETAVRAFHKTCRSSTGSGQGRKFPLVSDYQDGHLYNNIESATAVATVKAWIDSTIANGHVNHLLFHGIGTRPQYDVTLAEFTEIAGYLAASGARVMTLSDYYGSGLAGFGDSVYVRKLAHCVINVGS